MIADVATVLNGAPTHWTASTRLVAIAIADAGHGPINVASAARRTGLSERQVLTHVRRLVREGWIAGMSED